MKRPFLLTRFNFQILFSAWTLATVPCCSCTSVSLKPQIPPGLLLRRLRLNKPTTSYYNSNPSNGLVINKTHIVAEGGKRLEVTVGGGSGTFTLIDCLLKKNKTNSLRGLWQGKNVCMCVCVNLCRFKCVREIKCFSRSAVRSSRILLFLSQSFLVHCYHFITLWPQILLTRRFLTPNPDPCTLSLLHHISQQTLSRKTTWRRLRINYKGWEKKWKTEKSHFLAGTFKARLIPSLKCCFRNFVNHK